MNRDFHLGNVEKLREVLNEHGLAAAVVDDPGNLFFFTGFATSVPAGVYAVIPAAGEPFMVMQQLEAVLFRETGAFPKVVIRGHRDPCGDLISAIRAAGIRGRIGVHMSKVSALLYERFRSSPGLEPIGIGDVLDRLRLEKTAAELACIRKSCSIAMRAMAAAVEAVEPGRTELEVADAAVHSIFSDGAEPAFLPTVQTGSRGSLPNAFSSEARIQEGDFVVIDIGVRFHGYCSDICRTVVCGTASSAQKELLFLVKKAQEAAIQVIAPSVPASEVDKAARSVIDRAGYGHLFIHRTGHGIGCDVHERPFLGPDHDDILKPGVVLSVEPGVYDKGFGGVRIEDNILTTEYGHEVLTSDLPWDIGV